MNLDSIPASAPADTRRPGRLFLAGYGGADPVAFFAALAAQPIDVALDIRLVPKGWTSAYTGAEFRRRLETDGRVGRARWVERLGNAGRFDGSGMRLVDPGAIVDLISVLRRGLSVVVICGCAKEETCHRRLVADLVAGQAPDIEQISLPSIPPLLARKATEPPTS